MILWFICVVVNSLSQVIFAFQKKKKKKNVCFSFVFGYGNVC